MVIFLENVFSALFMIFFLAKNQKTLNVGKIGNCDDKSFFSKKTHFRHFRSLFHKIGEAQIMPVVAGRLIVIIVLKNSFFESCGFFFKLKSDSPISLKTLEVELFSQKNPKNLL